MHVVCAWIGNSAAVAAKHYLQVTDEHFEQAARPEKSAAQNPAQQRAEMACNSSHQEMQNPGFSGVCQTLPCTASGPVGGKGLEPSTSTV
jgi:hypothetical protein